MGRNQRDEPTASFAYTDWNEDLDTDCDTDADNAIADALGTLAKALAAGGSSIAVTTAA